MDTQNRDIVENFVSAGNFTKLHNAMKAADLVKTYEGIGPFTFFAPTDEAFGKLASILNFHAIRGAVLAKDMKERESRSLQGQSLCFAANDAGFSVNGANISRQEIEASNGVIHAIDTLLMPSKD